MTPAATTLALTGVLALALAAPKDRPSGAGITLIVILTLIIALYGVYELSGRQIDDEEERQVSGIPRYYDGWEAMKAHPELSPYSWPCRGCGEPWNAHSDRIIDDPDQCPGSHGYCFDPHPDIALHPDFEEEDDQ